MIKPQLQVNLHATSHIFQVSRKKAQKQVPILHFNMERL